MGIWAILQLVNKKGLWDEVELCHQLKKEIPLLGGELTPIAIRFDSGISAGTSLGLVTQIGYAQSHHGQVIMNSRILDQQWLALKAISFARGV